MAEVEAPIDVEKSTLGKALRNGPLSVPNYQREYAWHPDRVKKLFDDLGNAMLKVQSSYFLGTIVLRAGKPPSVVDGQQRLATTSVFLAAVRDAFLALKQERDAASIEDQFLYRYDRNTKDDLPHLLLNTDDRTFMRDRVLLRPDKRGECKARLHSHRRIDEAARVAANRVDKIVANADTISRKVDSLNAWVNFIQERAVVVLLTAPTDARAYQMFKTLNDRAQRTTQADMIKNHLFEQADPMLDEAQSKWSTMRSTIEGMGLAGDGDPLLTYLHQVSIVFNGPIKADDIFEEMEQRVVGQTQSRQFLEALATYAGDYVAIWTPSQAKWGSYDVRVRRYVDHISQEIKMTFIRPLMLSVAAKFSAAETLRAFRVFASWAVRFLIAGGSRSGVVEKAFGETAHAITEGRIKTANDLVNAAVHVVPSDTRFQSAFCKKGLANSRQARFLLRELEAQKRTGQPDELEQPVDDTTVLSLEHILPKNPSATLGWEHFTPEQRRDYRHRIGNLILINSKDNGASGDKPYETKRPFIEKSKNLKLTEDVLSRAGVRAKWTMQHIDDRQKMLAALALARWPLKPGNLR